MARISKTMNSLIHLTRIYSENIRISFSLDKCRCLEAKRGKMIRNEGVELPEGKTAIIEGS